MDPVSQLLQERERARSGLGPYFLLAAAMHALCALTVFVVTRATPHRPLHLPTVAVRLVRPPQAVPRARPVQRQEPAPAPAQPRPEPTAAIQPTAAPQPVADPPTQASADAMPELDATPAPVATRAPAPATGSGLSLAGESSRASSALPADFHFTYYVQRMLALIETRWYKPPAPVGTRAQVRFRVHRDGRMDGIALEETSGVPSFDRAALRALYAANPLPPLPPAYRSPSITVHLTFSE